MKTRTQKPAPQHPLRHRLGWRVIGPLMAVLGLLWVVPAAGGEPSPLESSISSMEGVIRTLDEGSLATVHGKGAEGPTPHPVERVAVILWDESGSGKSQPNLSSSTGTGNVQISSISMR